jgi:hypothetical protein
MSVLSRACLAISASLVLAAPPSAAAQEPGAEPALDPGRAVVVAVVEDGQADGLAARFAESLADALLKEAQSAGYEASRIPGVSSAPEGESEAARKVAADAGARWSMVASARLDGTRILWRASVYDGSSGSLMGADSFSAYAGLSALALIGASAANAVSAAGPSIAQSLSAEVSARPPIAGRLRFASPDEGAVVYLGDRILGVVEGGALEARYFPFRPGEELVVRIEKDGYWPRTQKVKISESSDALRLKPLARESAIAYGGNYGTGRILGAAASFRHYLDPDRVYLRAEASLWVTYGFSRASRPVLHDELRLGLGAYILFDPQSRFRASVGTGMSAIGTALTAADANPRTGMDVCLEPVFYTFEWHEPDWALVFEARYPYSLGAASGFLRRGWLSLGEAGPQFYSIGILFKR